MVTRLRTALMWLLLLALPLQGFAAATMVNCGPNHHRMAAAPVAATLVQGHVETHAKAHAHGRAEHHPQAAGSAVDHGAVAVATAAAAPADGHGQHAVQQLDKLSKANCSACAACCMGVALPAAPLVIASCVPAIATAGVVAAPHLDFLSDGLDRPPRLALA